ncbi:MAG: FG-GAP-like repeat-containing protein [Flavobacteriales bacterium]
MKKILLFLIISSSHYCLAQTFTGYELTDNLFRIEFCEAMQMDDDPELEIVVETGRDRKLTSFDFVNQNFERHVMTYDFRYNCFGFDDMDDDGDDDILAYYDPEFFEDFTIVWLENDANTNLIEHFVVTTTGAIGIPKCFDFDQDGAQDILFSQDFELHMLSGSSMFQEELSTTIPYSVSSLKGFDDMNNDGLMDLIAVTGDDCFILQGISSFEFVSAEIYFPMDNCQISDLNGDNLPELIYTYNDGFGILNNTGNLQFTNWNSPSELNGNFGPIRILDFDSDNDLDFLSYETGEGKLQFIEMEGNNFIQKSTILESNVAYSICAGLDNDLDGDMDLISIDFNRYQLNHLLIESQQCDALIAMHKPFWQTASFAAAELNNEPGIDLVFTDELDYKIHYIKNITSNPNDFTYEVIDLNLWALSYNFIIYDWNNDGVNDLVTSSGYDTIMYLTGFDTENITAEFIVDVPGSATFISGIADFDNNGFNDILYGYNTTNIAWNNNGVFSHTEILDTYHTFDIADFDSDGWPDIAFSKWYVDYQVKTIVWNNAGNFDSESEIGYGISNASLTSHDVNLDGLMDVVYIDADGSNLAFNLNNGDRTFAPAIINNEFEMPEFAYGRIKFADLNGDGRKDVLVDANPWVLYHQLEDFTYSFDDTMQWPMNYLPGMFYPITTVDVNGDQFDDIITTSWHSSILWCLSNNGDFESNVQETASTSSEIELFPNPCFDHITLSIPNSLNFANSIRIFDASGRDCSSLVEVSNNSSADKIDIDVRALASGLYQVVVTSGDPNKSLTVATILKQ